MTRGPNPALLSPQQRLAEVAALLAIGHRRLCLNREKELDGPDPNEPSCANAVHETENRSLAKPEQENAA